MAYVISGVISDAAGPCARLVRLFSSSTGAFVDEMTSDATTGEYLFTGLTAGADYDVVAFDPDYVDGGGKVVANVEAYNTISGEPGAHRYWRVVDWVIASSLLEISEFQLWDADGNTNSDATVTSSVAPTGQLLSYLTDGDVNNRPQWSGSLASDSSFWVKWDFGASPKNITGIKVGGWDTASRTPTEVSVQYSDDDSSWTTLATVSDIVYPGVTTLGSLNSFA